MFICNYKASMQFACLKMFTGLIKALGKNFNSKRNPQPPPPTGLAS